MGDYVWSEDTETGEQSLKKVLNVIVSETDVVVHVATEENEITTTQNHPFYVEGKGWTSASELEEGDVLHTKEGVTTVLQSVEIEQLDEAVKVYNLEVENGHTYYVTGERVLVHNDCGNKGESGSDTGYVEIEGRGSTGRVVPNDLIEEMVMDSTKRNPFDPGGGNTIRKVIESLNDKRWKGWEKWEAVYRTDLGRTITIHFSYDSINNLFDDFKFKN